jgi:hypothetical protein
MASNTFENTIDTVDSYADSYSLANVLDRVHLELDLSNTADLTNPTTEKATMKSF